MRKNSLKYFLSVFLLCPSSVLTMVTAPQHCCKVRPSCIFLSFPYMYSCLCHHVLNKYCSVTNLCGISFLLGFWPIPQLSPLQINRTNKTKKMSASYNKIIILLLYSSRVENIKLTTFCNLQSLKQSRCLI